MLLIAQVGVSVFGCAAFVLVTQDGDKAQRIGTALGLASVPFWWLTAIADEQWLTLPAHLVYSYGWLSKACRLWRKGS